MFKHAIELLKLCINLKTPLLEHYFTSVLNDLSTKKLGHPLWIINKRNCKNPMKTYATPSNRAWVPQHKKKQSPPTTHESMDEWTTTKTTSVG
jgi:hypothetical protein